MTRFFLHNRALASVILFGSLSLTACSAGVTPTTSASATATASSTSSVFAGSSSSNNTASATATTNSSSETISAASAAAQAFLDTLSTEEKDAVLYDYNDENKSVMWSNFPITFIQRSGIALMDMTEEQQAAAMKVIEASVNEETYQRIQNIMAGDEFLVESAGQSDMGNTHYQIGIFGDPTSGESWSLQFGGHHIGLNVDFNPSTGKVTYAPTHWGAQPTQFTDSEGKTVESFATIYDAAFAFYDSLDETQKSKLYQGEELGTMVCEPGSTCDYPTGTGLKGSDLNDKQKQLLLDLIGQWAAIGDDETNESTMSEIEATLDETYVNWSGATALPEDFATATDKGIYFQISGPRVYIEFANQDNTAGAEADGVSTTGWGHVHTIYRDPENDYAGSVEQQRSSGPAMGGGPGGEGGEGGGQGGPGGNPPTGQPPARN